MRGQALRARGPSALRLERLIAKVEAELGCSARERRYVFHPDEVAEAEAQGLPYALVPRVCSSGREWMERWSGTPSSPPPIQVIDHDRMPRRAAKLYLPSGSKYFGSGEAYGLTYTSCQESRKSRGLFRRLA